MTSEPFEKTAAMPLMLEEEKRLVELVDSNACYTQIFDAMLGQQAMIDSVTIKKEDVVLMRRLFHTLPRPLLRSVLMRRVAYDLYKTDSPDWAGLYKTDAGAYIAGIHIRGRGGKFLGRNEMVELVKSMRNYTEAVRLFETGIDAPWIPYTHWTIEQHELLRNAMDIDSHFGRDTYVVGNSYPKPRYRSKGISGGIDMLDRWISLHEGDPETPWRQSPLMVGNSSNRASRMLQHDPNHLSMNGTPELWALTLSVIFNMGLIPHVVVAPVLTCWEVNQINPAEVLGTIMARSMSSAFGFNVKQPGTRGTAKEVTKTVLEDSREWVYVSPNSVFAANVKASMLWLEAIEADRKKLDAKHQTFLQEKAEVERSLAKLERLRQSEAEAWENVSAEVSGWTDRARTVTRNMTDLSELLSRVVKKLEQ